MESTKRRQNSDKQQYDQMEQNWCTGNHLIINRTLLIQDQKMDLFYPILFFFYLPEEQEETRYNHPLRSVLVKFSSFSLIFFDSLLGFAVKFHLPIPLNWDLF